MDNMRGGLKGPPGSYQSSSEMVDDAATGFSVGDRDQLAEEAEPCAHRLGRASFLCDLRHDADQTSIVAVPEPGVVSRWRMKDRVISDAIHRFAKLPALMKTGYVALVMCLNIGVDPPDVIKISPCAHMECWIDPLSMSSSKALDAIGKSLQSQYERWPPRAKYKVCLDPTVDEVKKLCVAWSKKCQRRKGSVSLQRARCAKTNNKWRDLAIQQALHPVHTLKFLRAGVMSWEPIHLCVRLLGSRHDCERVF